MRPLGQVTADLQAGGRKALVAFLTAGYPDEDTFKKLVRVSAQAGCDVIEIGIPFSDPVADGPVIQASSTAVLSSGMTLPRALDLAAEVAPEITSALAIMSYINPIMAFGEKRFANDASKAGVSGVILPDVPMEEWAGIRRSLAAAKIEHVVLVAPTSSDARVAEITKEAGGFVYLVSVTGVTGAQTGVSDELPGFVRRVRRHTNVPAYVGFGISTPEQAREVASVADGVIIGSRLIKLIDEGPRAAAVERVGRFLSEVRAAIDAVT